MTLVRWQPAREMASLQDEVNRLFSTFFDTPDLQREAPRRWIPAMDLAEQERAYVLQADLPGLDEQDVAIEVEDDVLTISGERRRTEASTETGLQRVERATGVFRRSLTLPPGTDADNIHASFDKGVLEIRIPKPEERTPRRVTINAGPRDLEGDLVGAET